MKRTIMTSVLALFSVVVLSSCNKNKCHECHYDKAGAEIELGEFCGQALEDLEALGTYTDSTGTYTVHCHEH
ncbi:MAG: hypothetical protein RL264_1383 [Bacteroidota bacterium]|jgi:hypothetical protein